MIQQFGAFGSSLNFLLSLNKNTKQPLTSVQQQDDDSKQIQTYVILAAIVQVLATILFFVYFFILSRFFSTNFLLLYFILNIFLQLMIIFIFTLLDVQFPKLDIQISTLAYMVGVTAVFWPLLLIFTQNKKGNKTGLYIAVALLEAVYLVDLIISDQQRIKLKQQYSN